MLVMNKNNVTWLDSQSTLTTPPRPQWNLFLQDKKKEHILAFNGEKGHDGCAKWTEEKK